MEKNFLKFLFGIVIVFLSFSQYKCFDFYCNLQVKINSKYNVDHLRFTNTSYYTCSKLNSMRNKGYLILLRLESQVPGLNYDTDMEKFGLENETFRKNNCGDTYQCSKSLMYTIYNYGTKNRVLISTGTDMAYAISKNDANYIVQNSGPKIENYKDEFKNRYEAAFEQAIADIEVKINSFKPTPGPTPYPPGPRNNTWWITLLVIFGIICLICFIAAISKSSNSNSQNIEQNSNSQYNPPNSQDESIHNHVTNLLKYVKEEIRKNNPPVANIEKCIICLNDLNPNWQQEETAARNQQNFLNQNNNNWNAQNNQGWNTQGGSNLTGGGNNWNTQNNYLPVNTNSHINIARFNCGHYYHKSCLSSKNLIDCIMCDGIESQISFEPAYRYYNVCSEGHIISAIQKLEKIYPRQDLQRYAHTYSHDIVYIKEVYPSYGYGYRGYGGYNTIWIDDPWVPIVPVVPIGGYGYNPGYNQGYNQGYYDSGYNHGGSYNQGGPDHGGYNVGGDFGGNSYGGGDFGGGDYGGDNVGGDF